MKKHLPAAVFLILVCSLSAFAQRTVVIYQPNEKTVTAVLSATEQKLMDKGVLPKVRKKLISDACSESVDISAIMHGAFNRAAAAQTLVFYQFCQTGNGLGSTGIAVFEGGKVVGNYISTESGWTMDAKTLPDINQNGVDEIALFYSGGMHQGSGGIGVDIMEFSGRMLKGIGWFQAQSFTETTDVEYKVTAKSAIKPLFFREKWSSPDDGKPYRKVGNTLPLKLKAVFGSFEELK
ncbi:MAG: hypothetical protein ABI878_04635 [Acidobacteriota bacterium]